MIESPFVQMCQNQDVEFYGRGLDLYYERAFNLHQKDPYYLTKALIDDFTYRAKFQMNIIMSVEGEQGEYKSLFSLFWAYKIGEIFGQPFDMNNNLYVIPEDLDHNLRNSVRRSTHFLDEGRKKNVGVGAMASKFSLIDFEEQCRYTQKNIIYASPEVQDHAHYFVFRSYTHERIDNPKCKVCPVQEECVKNKWETKCEIPFYKRIGYPESMTFFLFTRRKIDKHEVLRGLVTVPMPTPETLKLYDKIKSNNIKKLENQEEDSFKYIQDTITNFVSSEENNLVKMVGELKFVEMRVKGGFQRVKKDTRRYVVMSEKLIENYLYLFLKSRRKFTSYEVKLIVAGSKSLLIDVANKKNSELESKDENIFAENK